mgnify:CR=1 FL=1
MGTGILALPYAIASSGIVFGVIFLAFAASTAVVSLHFLAQSAQTAGRPATFYSVCESAMPGLSVVVDLIVVVNGACSTCADACPPL